MDNIEIKKNNEIYEKWEAYGFLEGLDETMAVKLSNGFETMANIILGGIKTYIEVETIGFVCLRRCLQNNPKMVLNRIEVTRLLDELNKFMTPESIELACKDSYNAIDGEAELLTSFCDEVYICKKLDEEE